MVLVLEHALPGPVLPVCERDLFMHNANPIWQDGLHEADIKLVMLPEGLNLNPATFDAMSAPEYYSEAPFANKTVLFIDGSAADGCAAWSVVCVRYGTIGTPALYGMAAASVPVASSHPAWIGALQADNIAAEMTTFIYASVLGVVLDFGTPILIAPDLELSVLLAEDRCTCKAHPAMVTLMHCLGHCLHANGGGIRSVRAHRAHPWNELADALAKFTLRTGMSVGSIQVPVLHELMSQQDVMWAWLSQQMMLLLHAYHLLRNLDSGMSLHLRRYQLELSHQRRLLCLPRYVLWRSRPMFSDHRLDFVLCSRAAFSLAHSTMVDTTHDSGFAHDDHLPVHLNVLGWLDLTPGATKFQWDFEAMVNPQRCAQFQAALSTSPIPTWTTDVDTHVQVWNVLQLAKQFFSRGPRVKQRPRLREATINLIALKRSVLDCSGLCPWLQLDA